MIEVKKIVFIVLVFLLFSLIALWGSWALPNTETALPKKNINKVLIAQKPNTQQNMRKLKILISQSKKVVPGKRGRGRNKVKRPIIKPQYKNCKGKDIYKLDSEFQDQSKTEASASCIDCAISADSNIQTLNSINQALHEKEEGKKAHTKAKRTAYQAFKEQLRIRVLGQVQTKIAQTKILKNCLKGEKSRKWFAKRMPKVDWPLMKAVCKQKKEDFESSFKDLWPEMRVQLALSAPALKEDRILSDKATWLDSTPSHLVSDFVSLPKLSKKEREKAEKIYIETLSKTPLEMFTSREFKNRLHKGGKLHSYMSEKHLTSRDQSKLRKAERDLQKKAKDSYLTIMNEMPLLGYTKTGNPQNEKDMDQTFSEYLEELDDLLKKVKEEDADISLLLSFKPLVEGLLSDNKKYCLAAEGARLTAERNKSLTKWGLTTLGVVAAVPCFISGPVCLAGGLAVGGLSYSVAKGEMKNALGRALTGKEFETIASLAEKDSEVFWELMMLPMAAWGTTAGTIKFGKNLLKKGTLPKEKTSNSSEAITTVKSYKKMAEKPKDKTRQRFKKITSIQKTYINPKDVHIKQVETPHPSGDVMLQVQFVSPGKNKIDFELLIAEQYKKDVKISDLQKMISQMSEESIQKLHDEMFGSNMLTISDFGKVMQDQLKPHAFERVINNYGRRSNVGRTKLSSIGAKSVHIREISRSADNIEYSVQFKTQKGKKMRLKLRIPQHILDEPVPLKDLVGFTKGIGDEASLLDMKQKIQIAIGQMPAESFKGLKSITISDRDSFIHAGMVTPYVRGKKLTRSSKTYKKLIEGAFSDTQPHFLISKPVVEAWRRVIRGRSSEMIIAVQPLNRTPFGKNEDLTDLLAHELGHVLHINKFSTAEPGKKWMKAVKKDGTSVSGYGDTKLAEDFAEAMTVYIQTDGGTQNPQALRDFANRFEILDKLMKQSLQKRKSLFKAFKERMEQKEVAFVTSTGVLSHVVVRDHVYILPPSKEEK